MGISIRLLMWGTLSFGSLLMKMPSESRLRMPDGVVMRCEAFLRMSSVTPS